jgi:ribosome maturation factor RimP
MAAAELEAMMQVRSVTEKGKALAPDVVRRLEELVQPSLRAMGYDLVRMKFSGGVLQIMVERISGEGISVDDCAEVSRSLSALLDVDDPLPGPYTLEVSSPGIDRPLVRIEDYVRFQGRHAKIELAQAIDGRRRWRGRIGGVSSGHVTLQAEDGPEIALPFARILSAKLVLSDDLIAKDLQGRDAQKGREAAEAGHGVEKRRSREHDGTGHQS